MADAVDQLDFEEGAFLSVVLRKCEDIEQFSKEKEEEEKVDIVIEDDFELVFEHDYDFKDI